VPGLGCPRSAHINATAAVANGWNGGSPFDCSGEIEVA